MQAVNIRVFGVVQGVFFRKSTKGEADRLGLVGWVRNDRDGSVEIMASGEKKVLDQFTAWCKKGPPMANVESVEVDWLKAGQEFDGFSII